MALLKGFPPSNNISTWRPIPEILEVLKKVSELKPQGTFAHRGAKFMLLSKNKAVCYQGDDAYTPGEIYVFDDIEVTSYEMKMS